MAAKKNSSKTPNPSTDKKKSKKTVVVDPEATLNPKRKNKPGAGRPPDSGKKPTQEQINQIRNYSKIRLSTEEIAHLIGTSKRTLMRWMHIYPEILGTIRKARSESKAHAVNCAYLRAFPLPEQLYDESGNPVFDKQGNPVKKIPKGDTALAIFLLKTMFGFKEPDKKISIDARKGDTQLVFKVGESTQTTEEITSKLQAFYDAK
jgi:DNA-binding transcriptional regulator YiaG